MKFTALTFVVVASAMTTPLVVAAWGAGPKENPVDAIQEFLRAGAGNETLALPAMTDAATAAHRNVPLPPPVDGTDLSVLLGAVVSKPDDMPPANANAGNQTLASLYPCLGGAESVWKCVKKANRCAPVSSKKITPADLAACQCQQLSHLYDSCFPTHDLAAGKCAGATDTIPLRASLLQQTALTCKKRGLAVDGYEPVEVSGAIAAWSTLLPMLSSSAVAAAMALLLA